MTELHWTEVDHVTTVWTDAPPPLRAGLLFRSGMADETLAAAGQTHLIEHLALSLVPNPAQRHNGYVGGVVSGFFTVGQAQEVAGFLASISEALGALPEARLEGEKQVLAAENAARSYNFCTNLMMWRYGATGYGLMGMPQYGIRNATIEQLQERSAQRFTRENAVLWLSGPPPSDLRLNLPHGTKQPLPPLAPNQPAFPCWFLDEACGGVAVGATVPRVSASTVFCAVAATRLREQLRTVHALSYDPTVFYDHLNSDTAHLVLHADSDKAHRADLAAHFGEICEGLAKVDVNEVETAQQLLLDQMTGALAPSQAERMVMDVQRAANDWIFGREFESTEALAAEMCAVTAWEVAKIGSGVQAAAMFALPGEAALQPRLGKHAIVSLGSAVDGRETQKIDAPIQPERLVYGPDGVSLLWPNGSHATTRYSELAAALYYEDGGTCLIANDATTLTLEPTLWRDGHSICRKIRERVPAHLILEQGSRAAEAIPKPRTTAWQRFRALLNRR